MWLVFWFPNRDVGSCMNKWIHWCMCFPWCLPWPFHWGQTPIYPVDILRTNWEQLSSLFTKNPGGKFWTCSQLAHHFDPTVIAGQLLNLISKNQSIYPVGILSQNPGVSFIICPQHVWAIHQKFFHKLSSICSGTFPLGFFQYILNLISIWPIFPQTLN